MSTHSIHHVTAVTAQIRKNLEFYTFVLGLRLVKRSVNQDDVSAYHLFYADAVGSPGTDMTFFDWPTIGPNLPGAGTIALTSFRISAESFAFWADRLSAAGVPVDRSEHSIMFSDPEGQRLEFVDDTGVLGGGVPWDKEVPKEHAIRGILGVDLESGRPDSTRRVLTELLGFTATSDTVYETTGDCLQARVRIIDGGSARMGRVGAGG